MVICSVDTLHNLAGDLVRSPNMLNLRRRYIPSPPYLAAGYRARPPAFCRPSCARRATGRTRESIQCTFAVLKCSSIFQGGWYVPQIC